MIIKGYLYEYDDDTLTIVAPFSDSHIIDRREITECEIRLDDGRRISNKQRRHAYALIGAISDKTGYLPEEGKEWMKYFFCAESGERHFSLSDVDMTTARLFISYLIKFCIREGIPFYKDHICDYVDDIAHYVYCCIKYRKCAVCGLSGADIHHCTGSRVGMGRDRKTIVHEGLLCLPLCRECHNICHKSEIEFLEKNHIFGIKLDQHLCEVLGLNCEAS